MKTILGLVFLCVLGSANASELKLQKVKFLGAMKNKVIFQSTDVKAVKKSNIVRGKIVAQWGADVFEVATAFYTCNTKSFCKFVEFERLAMYESCVVKKNSVSCSKKIAGDPANDSRDVFVGGNPDAVIDGTESTNDDSNEFPARIEDEYSDLF